MRKGSAINSVPAPHFGVEYFGVSDETDRQPLRPNMAIILIAMVTVFAIMLACIHSLQSGNSTFFVASGELAETPGTGLASQSVATPAAGAVPLTPTADPPHPVPTLRSEVAQYVIQSGDTLGSIAKRFEIGISDLAQANGITNPDLVAVGQALSVPPPKPEAGSPDFKIIPDSELVYGPASAGFNIDEFVSSKGGYLANHQATVEGVVLTGAQIVQKVSREFSVNPRLMLALLDYHSGWVTNPNPDPLTLENPLGMADPRRKSLYLQMTWAANELNLGFYTWRVNSRAAWLLADGKVVPVSPVVNAGTAGVQQYFASLLGYDAWLRAIGPEGVFAAYNRLFGYPFSLAVEPLLPAGIAQPTLQLPFEPGKAWVFTGGPHGGWGEGSAWAALDFAPPGPAMGCTTNNDWVVAVRDGIITSTGLGNVFLDVDLEDGTLADGLEQTGWVVLYMHVESRDRVPAGTRLKAGDRIGHPSCEGGVSTGTHVHIARKYNGEWIPADQNLPFVMDGWTSHGGGYSYNGFLERNGQSIEAFAGVSGTNIIQR